MHPQIRQSEPGKCPLCAMDLIPAASSNGDDSEFILVMSDEAVRLSQIQTSPVTSGIPEFETVLPGKVVTDETRIKTVSSAVGGRIVNQYVRFVGASVSKNDPLVQIWSPELVAAQRELLDAVATAERHPELLNSAREKLRFWKLTDAQIAEIESKGVVRREVDILAPFDGIVSEINVRQDAIIQPGQSLYSFDDLSEVWIEFEIFEHDLDLISRGDKVEFTSVASPGAVHKAIISWIDPFMNPETRTTRARISVENKAGKWKPNMLAEGVVKSSGKYSNEVLMVPSTAVLWSGRRSVVYVKLTNEDAPTFESREVTLGNRSGDFWVVYEGVEKGEHVVTNGAFKIDASFQLRSKFSMMNREPSIAVSVGGHRHGQSSRSDAERSEVRLPDFRAEVSPEFASAFGDFIRRYLQTKDEFVDSNLDGVQAASIEMQQSLRGLAADLLSGEAGKTWNDVAESMKSSVNKMITASDIGLARDEFRILSETMTDAVVQFGAGEVVYRQYCPMAFDDEGGFWLSDVPDIRNPYLPETMLMCGEVLGTVE